MRRGRVLLLLAVLMAGLFAVRSLLALRLPRVGVAGEWPLLVNVTVVNPGGTRHEKQSITMRGGRIESITDTKDAPRAALPRLFEGRYVLPGLIDMNVRVPAWPGFRQALGVYFLYAGVTTVRDVGNFAGDLPAFLRRIEANEIPWPRLVACAQVIEGDPQGCPESRMVRAASEAGATVDTLVAAGARCVRVHERLHPEIRAAIRLAARDRGLPLIEAEPPAIDAIHPSGAARAAQSWLRRLRTLMPDGAEVLTPTLLPWAQSLADGHDPRAPDDDGLGYLPRAYHPAVRWQQEAVRAAAAGCAADGALANACSEGDAAALPMLLTAVRDLRAGGAGMVVGTGTPAVAAPPGFSVHREMMLMHTAGFSLEEVWVAATRAAGEALGIPQLGVVAVGAPADLLVFRQDPTRDLAAFATLEAVVMRGRLYLWQPRMRMALDHIKYFDQWLYDWSTRAWAHLIDWWDPTATRACAAL